LGSFELNVKLREIFTQEILHGVPVYLHEEKIDRSVRKITGYKVGNQIFIPRRNIRIFLSLPHVQTDCEDHIASIPMITDCSSSRGKDSREKDYV
jgi:hypothetical protein